MAIVAKNVVDRRKGFMYYVDGKGNVVETKLNRSGGKYGRTIRRKNKCTESTVDKRKA